MASANSQARSQPRKNRNWYLTDEILRGFDRYKYSSQDTSPLAIYVLHPFWNWVVNLIPQWVAPNLLTFLGFLCVVAYYFLIAYYDPTYNSEDGLAAPGWIWLVSGLLNFAAHTLDGIDGKQARRTGTGSPLGELFDHGLDSWTTGMFTASIYSLFGATGIYGISRRCYFYVSLFVLFNFISAHWEKYNTGLFCLPWTYDLSLTLITFIYIFAFVWGNSIYHISFALPSCVLQLGENIHMPDWFAVNVLGRPVGATLLAHAGHISVAELLSCFTVLSSLLLGFCYSAYHVVLNGKRGSFMEIVRPLVPCFTLFVLLAIWITASPSNIIDNYPRLVYWALGTTFAQTTSRLIVAQMSSTRCQLSHSCLFVLALCVAFCCLALPKLEALQQLALAGGLPPHVVATVFNALRAYSVAQLEMYVLQGYAAFVTIVHILYGAFVVYELRCHLNIRAFHIPHGAASSRPDASKKNK